MRRDFDFALLIGILLGFVLACLVIFLPFAGLTDFVYRWQTLIAGLAAIVAAAFALWGVRQQILHAEEMENERRARREYAARAMMSHALASLCEYAKQSCAELRGVLGDALPPKDPEQVKLPDNFKLLEVASLPIEPLQQLLQFGNKDIQEIIAELMSQLQVQQSRIQNRDGHVIDNIIFARWYYTLIADALEVYARASSLFAYARNPDGQIPGDLTKDSFYSAAHNCGFWQPKWRELTRFIEEERPQS